MRYDITQNIKDCGRSLVNNAEKIAEGLPKYTTHLSLTCYPDEEDKAIYINVDYDFVPEEYIERLSEEEL